ncbi:MULTISPECIES: hypothetical protein [Bacillota]|jgi:hypothetical protein|uniref:Uncharacterized protein n=1 Tax=Amedibacillus hominis TaxID=2897776 RepID=A0ABS9R8R0_9FIRM|nr:MULTISPECIES: hypothetical protein [Bacillota]MCH4286051.1 hypothetical protein [Amedibacillus hominis]RGB51343.1 hypothetical protein DW271_15055 [Absiella sp. AM22-9]RGB52211.1 hypothetical protein DW120_20190 [Absiella sp. AM10-20]RHU00502.1 hypothetical protein DW716_19395 [Absiella sp. AM27-20]
MAQKLANKDINLLAVYKVKSEPSKYASVLKVVAIPAVAAIVFVTIFGVQQFRIHGLKSKTDDVNAQIAKLQEQIANDPNAEKNAKYLKDLETLNQLKELHEDIESYPQLSQDTFDQILLASDLNVDVTSFSYVRESQVITLQIQGLYANDTENFVRRLKTSNIFSKVDYSGYSMSEQAIETEPVEQPTQQQSNQTDTTTDKDGKDNNDATQQLLQQLLNMQTQNNQNTETQKPQTQTVYTATVLCTLK